MACEQCNRSGKRTYYDPQLPLINPYTDDPEEHFNDLGPLVMPQPTDTRAYVTEKILKLNRTSLVEKRTERIMSIERLLRSWAQEENITIKKVIEQELHDEYDERKEFSSTVKAYLKANDFPVHST